MQKCAHCGKEFKDADVKQKYGTSHFSDYGCCSEQCYIDQMTGVPKPPNEVHGG